MKLLLVFNPNAANGRALRLLPEIQSALERFARLDVLQTTSTIDAHQRVAGADISGYDGLIAAGGDGTLFEVLNGLYCHDRQKRIPLGLIPTGTGNAFARDLGLLPGQWKKAIDLIRAGNLRQFDVGRVEYPGGCYHFLNIVGSGLPVDAMISSAKLKFLGTAAYTLAAFWHAIRLRSYPLVFEIDGNIIEQECMFLEVSNTRYTGTSFLMAPDAVFDDGLFDITLLGKISTLRLLRLFPTIFKGEHVLHKEVTTLRGREIRILTPKSMALAPDGELQGCTPAKITCLRCDVQLFCA